MAPRRAPRASIATAVWACLWVSTPTMTSAEAVSTMAGAPGLLRGLTVGRADRTVTGRKPSSSYQVTTRSAGRRRPEGRRIIRMTRGQSHQGSGPPGGSTHSQPHHYQKRLARRSTSAGPSRGIPPRPIRSTPPRGPCGVAQSTSRAAPSADARRHERPAGNVPGARRLRPSGRRGDGSTRGARGPSGAVPKPRPPPSETSRSPKQALVRRRDLRHWRLGSVLAPGKETACERHRARQARSAAAQGRRCQRERAAGRGSPRVALNAAPTDRAWRMRPTLSSWRSERGLDSYANRNG